MPFVQKNLPCPIEPCTSSDAYAIDDKGNGHCFSCKGNTFNPQNGTDKTQDRVNRGNMTDISYISKYPSCAMPERGITEDVAKKYGVKVECSEVTGLPEKYFFPYYKSGKVVGYKVLHTKKKEITDKVTGEIKLKKVMYSIGDLQQAELFGSQVVGDSGKMVIITEGEIDTLSAYQMLKEAGKNYKVVSLPTGANTKGIKDNLEFLERFDTVMLNLDMDEQGQDATEEAKSLIPVGSMKVMALPVKDANELLLSPEHKSIEYLRAVNAAKTIRPDGIVNLMDSWDIMHEDDAVTSTPYPWKGLNGKLYGMRYREIITLTSGSGMGKSAVTRELTHHLLKNTEDNIGVLALEESVQRTAWGIVSVEANLPLSIREERFGVDKAIIRESFDKTIGTGRILTLDHFGSTSEDTLLSRVRYLIKSMDCRWIILDHLSIVVSAMDQGQDERKTIDSIMTRLRQLVEETNAGLILVSHLRRANGDKGHEQGIEVSLSHLRGSQSIAQLSDAVIALERDQQADDEKTANLTRVRVLKNRYAGLTGLACSLFYERDTGRLREITNVNEFLNPEGEF